MLFTDQLERKLELNYIPQRIISLVPSQTELLYDLGLRDEVIGITKFCIHPEEWFRSKTRIGGTKQLDLAAIRALRPDLIIGNKEENEKAQVETLMQEFPVWMSDITTLRDALDMIARLGALLDRNEQATHLKLDIESRFNRMPRPESQVSTAYFIWRKPYMVAGHDTFIDHLLQRCGFENVFGDQASRYPEVDAEQIRKANPAMVLLSSEPYPFREKHVAEIRELLPSAKIRIVDGELFSWYGSRLLHSPYYLQELMQDLL